MICYLLLTENFEKFLAEVFYQFNAKFDASSSFRKVFTLEHHNPFITKFVNFAGKVFWMYFPGN